MDDGESECKVSESVSVCCVFECRLMLIIVMLQVVEKNLLLLVPR